MNKRILELANQAGIEIPDSSVYNGHIYQNSIERFAKLLVKDCAKRIDYWESRQGEHSEDLLKYYGVTE